MKDGEEIDDLALSLFNSVSHFNKPMLSMTIGGTPLVLMDTCEGARSKKVENDCSRI